MLSRLVRGADTRAAAQERLIGELECMVMGSGPPLVLLPGLAPQNVRPVGFMRAGELQTMRMFARWFRTYWVGRPTGLEPGVSFAAITARTARSLSEEFADPVDVLGISTGGSIAQQLAAEHPDLVRRLVLVSTGSRLSGHAAATQRIMIELARRGRPRPLMAAFGRDVIPPWRGRSLAGAAMYVGGLRLYPAARDLRDFRAVLEAEEQFDLRTLPTITAPTLLISGGRDRFYEPGIIRETVDLIPGCRVCVYPERGHITVVSDRAAVREVIEFLR